MLQDLPFGVTAVAEHRLSPSAAAFRRKALRDEEGLHAHFGPPDRIQQGPWQYGVGAMGAKGVLLHDVAPLFPEFRAFAREGRALRVMAVSAHGPIHIFCFLGIRAPGKMLDCAPVHRIWLALP